MTVYNHYDLDEYQRVVERHGMGLYKRKKPQESPTTVVEEEPLWLHYPQQKQIIQKKSRVTLELLETKLDILNNKLDNLQIQLDQQHNQSKSIWQQILSYVTPIQSKEISVLQRLLSLGRGKAGR